MSEEVKEASVVENAEAESAVEPPKEEVVTDGAADEGEREVAGSNPVETEKPQLSEDEELERALGNADAEVEGSNDIQKEKKKFESFDFNKQFEFQDMKNIYLVAFEGGEVEEVKEDSVHNIIEKFKDKEITSITAKTSTVTSIFEGGLLQSKQDGVAELKGESESKKEGESEK